MPKGRPRIDGWGGAWQGGAGHSRVEWGGGHMGEKNGREWIAQERISQNKLKISNQKYDLWQDAKRRNPDK